jgi:transposase
MASELYPQLFGSGMKALSEFESIYIHRGHVDLRKSINGLSSIVSEEMKLSFSEKSLFIFCNRKRNLMKMLYFDRTGFALWLKKLGEGKFPWAGKMESEVVDISLEDLNLLLSGVNVWTRFEELHFEKLV